jgi:hypothetical protein
MPVRSIFLAALLCIATPVAAQHAIQSRMSPEEFKAAGLDKLSAGELSRLEAWVDRTIGDESEKVAAGTRQEIDTRNRGFLGSSSREPVVGHIVGDFRGLARGREYVLDNGQVWRQVDAASLAGARRENPRVEIGPSLIGSAWYMAIEGYNTRAKVERIK